METIFLIFTSILILFGVGTMIYFGIIKTIDGRYVSKAFIGDDDQDEDEK